MAPGDVQSRLLLQLPHPPSLPPTPPPHLHLRPALLLLPLMEKSQLASFLQWIRSPDFPSGSTLSTAKSTIARSWSSEDTQIGSSPSIPTPSFSDQKS